MCVLEIARDGEHKDGTDTMPWQDWIMSAVIRASRTWLNPAAAAWDFRPTDEHHSWEGPDEIDRDMLKR